MHAAASWLAGPSALARHKSGRDDVKVGVAPIFRVCVGGGGGLVGVCKIVGTSWEGVDCVRLCVSYSIFLFAGYCC